MQGVARVRSSRHPTPVTSASDASTNARTWCVPNRSSMTEAGSNQKLQPWSWPRISASRLRNAPSELRWPQGCNEIAYLFNMLQLVDRLQARLDRHWRDVSAGQQRPVLRIHVWPVDATFAGSARRLDRAGVGSPRPRESVDAAAARAANGRVELADRSRSRLCPGLRRSRIADLRRCGVLPAKLSDRPWPRRRNTACCAPCQPDPSDGTRRFRPSDRAAT